MEPRIQYAQTADGVSIAYYAIGQGPVVLCLTMQQSHLEAEWRIDPLRMAITAAAQWCTFVRLDPRGFGLSDRDPDDFALDSLVLDIEAVVDRLGLDELRIYSLGFAAVPTGLTSPGLTGNDSSLLAARIWSECSSTSTPRPPTPKWRDAWAWRRAPSVSEGVDASSASSETSRTWACSCPSRKTQARRS